MSKHIEDETKPKETKQNWLLTSVNPSLNKFSKLPNHVLMSLVLMHLDGKTLHMTSRISKSFSLMIKEFIKTAAGQENFEQLLLSELRKLAIKRDTELKGMRIPEALIALEQVVEIKERARTLRVRHRQSNIYEKAGKLICCVLGGAYENPCSSSDVPMSQTKINILRIIFILLCGISALGLYLGISSGKDDDNTAYMNEVCLVTGGVTSITLLLDIVQSLYNCSQQREVNEDKSQLSFLRSMHSRTYTSTHSPSINPGNGTTEDILSPLLSKGNG